MSWKNENQLWADMKNLLLKGLNYWSIENWEIARSYQPTKGNFRLPVLLINLLSSNPIGAIEQHYKKNNGELERENSQREEWVFRIEAIKRRVPNQPQELTALDVLSKLRMWFNGPDGVESIWAMGYNSLLVRLAEVPSFLTEDDVFEMHPNLEIHLFLQQKNTRTVPSASKWTEKIKGV